MDEYTVEISGIEHTMQLHSEDAKRLGAVKGGVKADVSVVDDADGPSTVVSNKARTTGSK